MTFNETSHPRTAAGSPDGGKFASKPASSEADAFLDDGGPEFCVADVDALITEANRLAPGQVTAMVQAHQRSSLDQIQLRRAAKHALRHAAVQTGHRREGLDAARELASSMMPAGDPNFVYPAQDALEATAASHLIGQHGYTQAHHDELMRAWNAGTHTPTATDDSLTVPQARIDYLVDRGHWTADGDLVVLPRNATPAEGIAAAQQMLGTERVEFSHFAQGYPTYRRK